MVTIDVDIETILSQVLSEAVNLGLGIAMWRMPTSSNIQVIVDRASASLKTASSLEAMPKGFVLQPFINTAKEIPYLEAEVHFEVSLPPKAEPAITFVSGDKTLYKKLFASSYLNDSPNYFTKQAQKFTNVDRDFESLVARGVAAIKKGHFQKVVLSRTIEKTKEAGYNPINHFLALCSAYGFAMVSLTSTKATGTWLGASPETLLEVKEGHYFKTTALAGTQAKVDGSRASEATWTQKEIEEQALVSRYIVNCFKAIRLREFEEDGPKTVAAGHLLHLKTDFVVDLKLVRFSGLGSLMFELLHPTSAVCGMPKDSALQFIMEYEGYNRQLYSGVIGPNKVGSTTHLFVNLRCMQVFSDRFLLYAGAGITLDSNPSKEKSETSLKMKTMLL